MTSTAAAAVYVRISEDKTEDGAGVARQERDCRELAGRRGWSVAEVYVENDTSAYKRRKVRLPDGSSAFRVVRPAFRRLLDDLAAGRADAFIAYDLDRVARDPRDLEDLIDVVQSQKIGTAVVTGDVNLSTSDGVFMARTMVNVGHKASADTARRVTRKQLELAEQGKHKGGGIRSFGYEKDGMTVRDSEAEALRQIAARVLAGESLTGIARRLTDSGVPTVRGGPAWGNRSVHAVVTKPRVAGLREHHGEVIGPAAWPAILDRDTWEQVRMALQGRARGSTNSMVRWPSGVLRCSKCQHALSGSQVAPGRYRYWCATPKGGCGGIAIDAGKAERVVEALLLGYLSRPDVLADLRSATSSESTDRARTAVAADEAQLRELAGLWAARSVTTAEYMRARKDIEARLSRTKGLLHASLPGAVRDLVSEDVEDAWSRYVPAQRREVAQVVFPSGIAVQPSAPGFQGFDAARLVPTDWKAP
jgi:DNA invertase Pin-like site-specific DNA recombinase